jgi:hypothetical protein
VLVAGIWVWRGEGSSGIVAVCETSRGAALRAGALNMT